MEINLSDSILITLFNAIVCLALPRLLTLNWAQVFGKSSNVEQVEVTVGRENLVQ